MFVKWKRAIGATLLSLASWGVQAVMVHLCLEATGIDLQFAHAVFVLAAINVVVMIPSAPSSLGPFELAAVVALGVFGVAKTPGLSFALLYHVLQIVVTTLAGLVALSLLGLRVSDLSRAPAASPSERSP